MRRPAHSTLADACLDISEDLLAQPSLFDGDFIPVEVPILRAAKRFSSTGKLTTREEATALAIAACKLAGLSDRQTGKRVGVSATTVSGVMRLLESSGRIPAAQERLASRLGEMAESATSEIGRLITDADGDWTPASAGAVRALGIAIGIGVDKLQLLTGQATAIVEQRVGAPSADAVREWEGKLRQMFGPVIDVPSEAPDVQSSDNNHKCLNDRIDTVGNAVLATVNSHRADDYVASASPVSLGAGGGSAAAAGRS
jgi:hypothetical protein